MNEMTAQRKVSRETRAAEGLARWRWTTAELVGLTELGVFRAEDKFELIGGEIVPMSPAGKKHEVVREDLENILRARCSDAVRVVGEPQLNFSDDTYTEPDILVRPSGTRTPDVRGDTVVLVIEIAASSKSYDLATKASLYAEYGVREYWVVDAATLETAMHREPSATGYASIVLVPATDVLTPLLAPELAVRLCELDVD